MNILSFLWKQVADFLIMVFAIWMAIGFLGLCLGASSLWVPVMLWCEEGPAKGIISGVFLMPGALIGIWAFVYDKCAEYKECRDSGPST